MTKEQIEQRAQELYPVLSEHFLPIQAGNAKRDQGVYISGALSRQPEIDQLKERIKELEEELKKIANNRFEGLNAKEIATELLTKNQAHG